MKPIPPDRWRFPDEPRAFQRFSLWAQGIYWTSIVIGGGKVVFAVLYVSSNIVDAIRYSAPPESDGVESFGLTRALTDVALWVALLLGGIALSGILTMLVEVARNARRARMVQEIANGLTPVDPPGAR